jgi:ankyrin repeat protein
MNKLFHTLYWNHLRRFCLAALPLLLLTFNVAYADAGNDLIEAANKGDLSRVNELLAAKADVNAKTPSGVTSLIAASQSGHADVVQSLLAAKADVRAAAPDGRTALILASGKGHLEIVRLLLNANADVNAKAGDGANALMWASQNGHVQVVQALIAAGADVNAEDKNGRTALIGASYRGHLNVVKALLAAKGINPKAVTTSGATALEAAGSGGHADVRALLVKAGAGASTPGQPAKAQKKFDTGSDNNAKVLKEKIVPPAGACFAVVQDVSSCKGLTCTPLNKKESLANCYSLSAEGPNIDDAFYQIYISKCHSGEAGKNEIPLYGAETTPGQVRYDRGFSPPIYCRWHANSNAEPSPGITKYTNIRVGNDEP